MSFVKEINSFLHQNKHEGDVRDIRKLVQKIEETQLLVKDSESKVRQIFRDVKDSDAKANGIVVITRDKEPVCVLGEDVAKPDIKEIELEGLECHHSPSFQAFRPFKNVVYVKTQSQLLSIDRTISQAIIEVFDHTYRSYGGFSCFISLGDTNGNVYIVDAIKFRTTVPELALLKCGIPKIMHCGHCAQRLLRDFKQLGCFRSYNISQGKVFVDWRIRPVPEFLHRTLCRGVRKARELFTRGARMKRFHPHEEQDEMRSIVSKYGVPGDEGLIEALLGLRRFLARSNDESVHYVMTDDQLIRLLSIKPKTRDELFNGVRRLSSLVRQHAMDFLLVFSDRSKCFHY